MPLSNLDVYASSLPCRHLLRTFGNFNLKRRVYMPLICLKGFLGGKRQVLIGHIPKDELARIA